MFSVKPIIEQVTTFRRTENCPSEKMLQRMQSILFNNYLPKAKWILSNNPRDKLNNYCSIIAQVITLQGGGGGGATSHTFS